jgi:hypothetical protein
MIQWCLSIIALLLIFAFPVHAEEINAGFVQGLWYSSDQIIEGVPVRVYAALRNNTPHGTVRFMDNGTRIGSSAVSALSGRLVETWTDWTPGAGEHSLSIALDNAELHVIGGEVIKADVANITVEDTLVADIDTDKDGIGNITDTDDDNDGITDVEEKNRGSNPLVTNPKPVEEVIPEEVSPLPTPTASTTAELGLEQYLGEGLPSELLNNVTEKVEDAKQSLDAYREKRDQALSQEIDVVPQMSADTATITRSSIEPKNSALKSFVAGVRSLLQHGYTFLLFILSQALGHPALIQFLLLVGILYIFYRTARRLAGRPF